MKQHRLILLCLTATALFLRPSVSMAIDNQAMTDAAKKDTVYRMYAGYKKKFPAVRDIASAEARKLFQQGKVVFVDTRQPDEMAVSMLPGAIPLDEFSRRRERYTDKMAVVYCTISYRSGLFARDQADRGIDVVNLRGGILAWILEGGPVYDPQGNPTQRVHVYGDKWDYAPADWESVKFSMWERIF